MITRAVNSNAPSSTQFGDAADAEAEDRLIEEVIETSDGDHRDQGRLPESAVDRCQNNKDQIEEPDGREILSETERDPGAAATPASERKHGSRGTTSSACDALATVQSHCRTLVAIATNVTERPAITRSGRSLKANRNPLWGSIKKAAAMP